MTPPDWAHELVATVCAEAGVVPPRLIWKRRESEHSTGVTRHDSGDVIVRAGTGELDQRQTVLHELAHWLLPIPQRRRRRFIYHDRGFYAVAFDLYLRYGMEPADALRLESGRHRRALTHGVALGVPGAEDALAAYRESRKRAPRWEVTGPDHQIRLARVGRWTVCQGCGARIVGINLARIRRSRRVWYHPSVRLVTIPAE